MNNQGPLTSIAASMLVSRHYSFHRLKKGGTLTFSGDAHLYFDDEAHNRLADFLLSEVQGVILADAMDIELVTAKGTFEFDLSGGKSNDEELVHQKPFIDEVVAASKAPIVHRPYEIARYWPWFSVGFGLISFFVLVILFPALTPLTVVVILFFPFAAWARLLYMGRKSENWQSWKRVNANGWTLDPSTSQPVPPKRHPQIFLYVNAGLSLMFFGLGGWVLSEHGSPALALYSFSVGGLTFLGVIYALTQKTLSHSKGHLGRIFLILGVIVALAIIYLRLRYGYGGSSNSL